MLSSLHLFLFIDIANMLYMIMFMKAKGERWSRNGKQLRPSGGDCTYERRLVVTGIDLYRGGDCPPVPAKALTAALEGLFLSGSWEGILAAWSRVRTPVAITRDCFSTSRSCFFAARADMMPTNATARTPSNSPTNAVVMVRLRYELL